MRKKIASDKKQLGQTLIETLVAIFILVIGLLAALSLSIFSFQATDASSKQIIATALARQGVEAVKNIRDTNWLNDSIVDCSGSMGPAQLCYANWLGSGSRALNAGTYAIKFNTASSNQPWSLQATTNYVLNYDPSTGIYDVSGPGTGSIFSRSVSISQNAAAPFNAANPELKVVSTVWWSTRVCAPTADPSGLPPSCKVSLEMHLTNWRNY